MTPLREAPSLIEQMTVGELNEAVRVGMLGWREVSRELARRAVDVMPECESPVLH